MLANLASQIGFWPQLNFMVSASTMVDSLVTATTGAKAGFSTSAEAQVKKMLECLMLALTKIAVEQRFESTSSRLQHPMNEYASLPDRHEQDESSEEDKSETLQYPVIVIEGFMSKERALNDYIYDVLSKWAVQLEENHVCHVVFVSNNPAALKTLSKGKKHSDDVDTAG